MKKLIGSLLVGLGCLGAAAANPPAYTPPAVAAVVPVYGAVYAPADDEVKELLRAILAELRAGKAVPQAAAAPDPQRVARRACIGCHHPDNAEDLGGGAVLFDEAGKVVADPAVRKAAAARVAAGSMPKRPAKPLPAADRDALTEFLSPKEVKR